MCTRYLSVLSLSSVFRFYLYMSVIRIFPLFINYFKIIFVVLSLFKNITIGFVILSSFFNGCDTVFFDTPFALVFTGFAGTDLKYL